MRFIYHQANNLLYHAYACWEGAGAIGVRGLQRVGAPYRATAASQQACAPSERTNQVCAPRREARPAAGQAPRACAAAWAAAAGKATSGFLTRGPFSSHESDSRCAPRSGGIHAGKAASLLTVLDSLPHH
jgi:hypothetical protein